MWCPNPRCSIIFGPGSQFTCLDEYGISYNGKNLQELTQQPKGRFLSLLYVSYPCFYVSQAGPSNIELKTSLPLWSFFPILSCIARVSSKIQKKSPNSLAHFPFYNPLLVGSQCWCFIHFIMWTPPLFKIPNQMGPFEDSLETCTWR